MTDENHISVSAKALVRRNDVLLAVAGGVLLAIGFVIAFGVPWIRDMAVMP